MSLSIPHQPREPPILTFSPQDKGEGTGGDASLDRRLLRLDPLPLPAAKPHTEERPQDQPVNARADPRPRRAELREEVADRRPAAYDDHPAERGRDRRGPERVTGAPERADV